MLNTCILLSLCSNHFKGFTYSPVEFLIKPSTSSFVIVSSQILLDRVGSLGIAILFWLAHSTWMASFFSVGTNFFLLESQKYFQLSISGHDVAAVKSQALISIRPVHVLLSRFYPDFILILSWFYPNSIQIKLG